MKKSIMIAALLILLTPAVYAQQADDYTNHPGYIDFGSFDKFQGAEKTVEVFIKGPLLKFVAKAAEHEDPELASLLNHLKLIKVNVFSMDQFRRDDARNIMKSVSKKIDRNKWELMVRTKEPGEYVEVYTQFGPNDSLTGLVVMAVEEDDEAVFVNIAGDMDPAKLGKLSDKFNIPQLDSLVIESESGISDADQNQDISQLKKPSTLPEKYNFDNELESVDQIDRNELMKKRYRHSYTTDIDKQSIIVSHSRSIKDHEDLYYLLVLRRPRYSFPSWPYGIDKTEFAHDNRPDMIAGQSRVVVTPDASFTSDKRKEYIVIDKIYKLKGREQAMAVIDKIYEFERSEGKKTAMEVKKRLLPKK